VHVLLFVACQTTLLLQDDRQLGAGATSPLTASRVATTAARRKSYGPYLGNGPLRDGCIGQYIDFIEIFSV